MNYYNWLFLRIILGNCFSYTTISDSWRKIGRRAREYHCDRENNIFNGNNWVRFKEPAGVKLSNTDIGEIACGTHASGYMRGSDPTIVGQTLDRTACFSLNGNPCYGGSVNIKVSLCSDNNEQFLIYQLGYPQYCDFAYCAESNSIRNPEGPRTNPSIPRNIKEDEKIKVITT